MNKNIEKIKSYILSGCKIATESMIGIECEHFIVDKNGFAVSYYGKNSVEDILKELAAFYPNKEYSGSHLIALNDSKLYITLEPAAQIETSIIPCDDISLIIEIYNEFLKNINSILFKYSYSLVSLGYQPKSKADDLKIIPKERYFLMDSYFKAKKTQAKWMMRGSASVQVNIDYFSEADFSLKFKTAVLLSPVFYLLTDNAPIFESSRFPNHSARSFVWQNVDDDRCRLPKYIFDSGFSADSYARWVYSTNPIFLIDNSNQILPTHFNSNEQLFFNREISTDEIKHIMSMVFPDVRVKQFIEIRTGDSMKSDYIFAYAALIKGIFYNNESLQCVQKLLNKITYEEYTAVSKSISELGYEAMYSDMSVKDILKTLFVLAKNGLNSSEVKLLKPLESLLDSNKTPKSLHYQEALI